MRLTEGESAGVQKQRLVYHTMVHDLTSLCLPIIAAVKVMISPRNSSVVAAEGTAAVVGALAERCTRHNALYVEINARSLSNPHQVNQFAVAHVWRKSKVEMSIQTH
jgi:hypothetical protein